MLHHFNFEFVNFHPGLDLSNAVLKSVYSIRTPEVHQIGGLKSTNLNKLRSIFQIGSKPLKSCALYSK